MKRIITHCLMLFCVPFILNAQDTPSTGIVKGGLNVFIDGCWNCDFDNFRREINYVNFMRNRQEADVFVLVTGQAVGSGGDKFTLYFEGQEIPYVGMKDTLSVVTANDDTDRIISDKLLVSFRKGIMPYVLKSEVGDDISFSFNGKQDSGVVDEDKAEVVDPWDSWVFSVSAGGNANGESTYNGLSLRGRFSASRVTEENKFNIRANLNYRENKFHLIGYDSLGQEISRETFSSLQRSQYASMNYVKSLNGHWSAALKANASSNTFQNLDFSGSLKAGIEYDYFPYEESDRRSLTLVYEVGPKYNNYVDTTIYNKATELLWQHSFSVDLGLKQKWGSVYLGLSYSSYLHDLNLYSVSFNPNIDWNITKGLTFGVGGYFSIIGDQITLPKDEVDVPTLLLRSRIVATNFSYWGYFNIRYSFGSKYNNVVNPRFNGGGGGGYFFF